MRVVEVVLERLQDRTGYRAVVSMEAGPGGIFRRTEVWEFDSSGQGTFVVAREDRS